ncbi:MAG: cystathionine beta-lyase, partial [Comamonadaceae bacterium]
MAHDKTALDTRLMHTGLAEFDPVTGQAPVALPAVRTSTVRFENLDAHDRAQVRKGQGARVVTYGRMGMDTNEALENVFSQLENGTHTYLAPSGLSGVTLALLTFLSAGDHALISDNVYGPVRHLDNEILKRLNIEITYFSTTEDLSTLIRENTRVVYVETPGSLLFEMMDIPALAKVARAHDLPLVVDNTWGSGYIYRPLDLGAQVSVIAGTKYVGGHSDLLLGAVVTNDEAIARRINATQYALGYAVSADDAWLALRGVRTLPIRMTQHAHNAMKVCEFLDARPEVLRVFHPAWPKDAGHALWQRDCTGSNGMLSAHLNLSVAAGRAFVDALTLFGIGYSWGGFESLVQFVDVKSLGGHTYWGEVGEPRGVLVRLHIGLEAVEDVIEDLRQAFEQAQTVG